MIETVHFALVSYLPVALPRRIQLNFQCALMFLPPKYLTHFMLGCYSPGVLRYICIATLRIHLMVFFKRFDGLEQMAFATEYHFLGAVVPVEFW